jgi:DNA-binding XRE family transcriptional regulator
MREKRGLTQQTLAETVGTSQQQIQRLEAGTQSVKLDLALRVCSALRTDLGRVFPGTQRLLGRGRSRKTREELVELHYNPKALRDFENAGVDLDPATWILKLRLRGGTQREFVIATADAERLRLNLSAGSHTSRFFVFNSSRVAVAINLSHLLHYYELWDGHVPWDWHDENVSVEDVTVHLSDAATPLEFEVSADEGSPGEGSPDEDDDSGQLRGLLFDLQLTGEPGEFLSFMDFDGEHLFFRADDIALLTIPLRLINDRLNADMVRAEEGWDETDRSEDGDEPKARDPAIT